jgi:hypothetical protein
MSAALRGPAPATPRPKFTPVPAGLLQRQCACGSGAAGLDGECPECRKKALLQRHPATAEPATVPPIVQKVLQSGGQPLDTATRDFMEPRFGHDFGQVRVHTDAQAAESAQAVNALAYTVGREVVFGAGQYAPATSAGQRLVAHELTHVVQQSLTSRGGETIASGTEAEAQRNSQGLDIGDSLPVQERTPPGLLQRQPQRPTTKPLDADAEAIVAIASNSRRDLQLRAVELVYRIINKYFPQDADKVRLVEFDDKKAKPGLNTESVLQPQTRLYYGNISVGYAFINQLIADKNVFAGHVAQVGHELEHIRQHREGMIGPQKSHQREFLAHYHEAVFVEKPGSGDIHHSRRARHIDAALGLYYCLDQELQRQYQSIQQELAAKRRNEARYGYRKKHPDAPTQCTPPEVFEKDD